MKRLIRLIGLAAGVAAAAWLAKDKLLPTPAPPSDDVPRFRVPADETGAATVAAATPVPPLTAEDDLTDIKGIGPVYATRLDDHGISTFAALAAADPADVATRVDARVDQTEDWIEQARRRTAG